MPPWSQRSPEDREIIAGSVAHMSDMVLTNATSRAPPHPCVNHILHRRHAVSLT